MEKVTEFKEFVRQHPGLKDRVRSGDSSWQNLYEEWYLYGSDDKQWSRYKESQVSTEEVRKENEVSTEEVRKESQVSTEVRSNDKTDQLNGAEMMTQAFEYLQKVDIDKVQKTMGTFQQFIQLFQTMQGGKGQRISGPMMGQASKQNFSGFFSQFDD